MIIILLEYPCIHGNDWSLMCVSKQFSLSVPFQPFGNAIAIEDAKPSYHLHQYLLVWHWNVWITSVHLYENGFPCVTLESMWGSQAGRLLLRKFIQYNIFMDYSGKNFICNFYQEYIYFILRWAPSFFNSWLFSLIIIIWH